MFGYKKLIAQYDARILDLKAQIEDLRALAYITRPAQSRQDTTTEADAVIGGNDQIIYEDEVLDNVSEDKKREVDEIMSERDRILSGTY